MKHIFQIPLSTLSPQSLYDYVLDRCDTGSQTTIATLNPEILLQARDDQGFAQTLRSFTLRTIDGFGISLVMFLKHRIVARRMTGRVIVDTIIRLALKKNFSIGIIGGKTGIAKKACDYFKNAYQGLPVIDLSGGTDVVVNERGIIIKGEDQVENALQREQPQVVLVGFGAPKQERWIERTMQSHKKIKIAVGVGGILDVVAGYLKPPPKIFIRLGIEWLWRLLLQPQRLGRIFNAVIVFTFISLFRDHD